MPDNLTKRQRQWCMSRIRSRDTTPEVNLRKALWNKGFRYRLESDLQGRSDIIFTRRKIAIFVVGCF